MGAFSVSASLRLTLPPAPIQVVSFHGSEKERERLKSQYLRTGDVDVIVTSYEMLVAESTLLSSAFKVGGWMDGWVDGWMAA